MTMGKAAEHWDVLQLVGDPKTEKNPGRLGGQGGRVYADRRGLGGYRVNPTDG
jgi:hypothetical protein